MKNQRSPPPHKGARWIADQIAAAFKASRGGLAPPEERLSRDEVEDLVSRALEEAVERVEEREEPSPPAPLPRAGEG